MTTILAESSVFMVEPTASEPEPKKANRSSKKRVADPGPEPTLSQGWYEEARKAVRHGEPFTAEHTAALERYKTDHEAWEKHAGAKGRSYDPHSVWQMEISASETLYAWLKAVGAPEEVLTLAAAERRLTYAYLTNANHWSYMRDYTAADVAVCMPEARRAIKTVRECLKSSKA